MASVIEVYIIVGVVHEGHDDLVPAGEVARSVHNDQLSEPGDVFDLLLLELGVDYAQGFYVGKPFAKD